MSKKVRVRFAPSPTGPLHIGGVRTALFNYLFAKKNGGSFILRIEDTDQNRYVKGAENYIIEALNWCGITFDESPEKPGKFGPYRQSERKDVYKKYALELIKNGHAYYAFDSPEKLNLHRKNHEEKGKTFIYNWHNRLKLDNSLSLSNEQVKAKIDSGEDYVIRFKSPKDKTIHLVDSIRDTITIDTNILDDKVLFKSDGMPTYHLANIVDDHLMEITHVIRGEEWLPSLALHKLLYDAFEWEAPEFAHLSLILKPTGKGKLSKRDSEKGGFPIFPLSWNDSQGYREAGYLSEAVVNFLAMLGWNSGTEQELYTIEELVKEFSLKRVNKSGARFDPDKTKWYNHQYLQEKNNTELASLFIPLLSEKINDVSNLSSKFVEKVIGLLKERANFVSDFWELGNYFFISPTTYNEKAVKKQWKDNTPNYMQSIVKILNTTNDYTSINLETRIKDWITKNELPFGSVMGPLRLIIVGDLKGPHLFDILEMIGKEESISRINKGIEFIK